MDQRRQMLRDWFGTHPSGSVRDACRAFEWTAPHVALYMEDAMDILADGVRVDMQRTGQLGRVQSCGGKSATTRLSPAEKPPCDGEGPAAEAGTVLPPAGAGEAC